MKYIAGSISALAFATSILTATVAFATTPFDIATRASRGQIEGIPSNIQLSSAIENRSITGKDILEAAGLPVDPDAARDIEAFLRDDLGD